MSRKKLGQTSHISFISALPVLAKHLFAETKRRPVHLAVAELLRPLFVAPVPRHVQL